MNRKNVGLFFFISLTGIFYWSCQNTAESAGEEGSTPLFEEIIPGTWEAVSMYVDINSVDGLPDSNFVFRINDGDWERLFSVPAPRTYFEKDHKYRTEFKDKRDTIISITRGIWNNFGDTLMMIEPDQSYQYQISYDKGMLYFKGFRDWDEDGAEDDNYQEVKRRVSIGTE